MRLEREDYRRDAPDLAQYLLGKVLVLAGPEGICAGRIAETEAYCGESDPACHVYGGRRTPRTEMLYGECGHAYPYVIYGMHVLLNITAGPVGHCVLLRALEPLEGEEIMVSRRGNAARKQLTNGPGKLCRAMGVGMELYGADLCGGGMLYGEDREYRAVDIVTGPRIGVDYAGEAAGWPLRFGIAGSPFLSSPFPGIYKNNNRR